MPTVKGPLFSVAASGTYQGLLMFRTGGGKTTVGRPGASNKPRSAAQVQHSARVQEMAAYWSEMPEPDRMPWKAAAEAFGMNGRSLFWREWMAQGSTPENPPNLPP